MAQRINKLIVTNAGALKAKYGSGVSAINQAVKALVLADKARGLSTIVVNVDESRGPSGIGSARVEKAGSCKENKLAIDAAYTRYKPDYILILGATDVVPHQDLGNPVFDPDNDPDRLAWGDLPYACEAPYSNKIEKFVGPTRVVGRMPDLVGARDPSYLVRLLEIAARAKSRPAQDYASYLGVSAEIWQGSTTLSLRSIFGPAAAARLCPPEGPNWKKAQLSALSHFFNCHGAEASPQFYGQHGSQFPVAHDAALLKGKIANGTVLSAECCYGAELYDPTLSAGQMGICNAYLQSGAYAVFGSSTIAYGPATGNGSADFICQYFLRRVLAGASLGRAALEARQEFVRVAGTMDPIDLKTLAQFSLLGDPSLQPVSLERAYHVVAKSRTRLMAGDEQTARVVRRARLALLGQQLEQKAPRVATTPVGEPSSEILALLSREAERFKVSAGRPKTFEVLHGAAREQKRLRTAAMSAEPPRARRVHVSVSKLPTEHPRLRRYLAIVATEWNNEVIVRSLVSR